MLTNTNKYIKYLLLFIKIFLVFNSLFELKSDRQIGGTTPELCCAEMLLHFLRPGMDSKSGDVKINTADQ